jgi:uncharacterized UBP type Zn finger protein
MATAKRTCPHLEQLDGIATPRTAGCDQCLALGDTWVHLRACLVCGRVGCCDNSKNRHATKHYHETGHALVRSIEPGETWMWCYEDQIFLVPD